MVRNFKRKTDRGRTPADIMLLAVRQVKLEGKSIRSKAAKTLTPTTSSLPVGYRKNRQIFNGHQEQQLRDYIIKASEIYYVCPIFCCRSAPSPSHNCATGAPGPSHHQSAASTGPSHHQSAADTGPSHNCATESPGPSHHQSAAGTGPSHNCATAGPGPSHHQSAASTGPSHHQSAKGTGPSHNCATAGPGPSHHQSASSFNKNKASHCEDPEKSDSFI
ncbi:hypothetical protein Q7C36_015157 [Tachysurus vachellii]|uniref:Uncharacterized protein n=1 Tax=Tachysurus vachellii TaxID=175792 RepID=A0AA88MBH0_TACVA|nr:hypothetical protein Q7C36_015157 [Tachysurus vachellii]